MDLTDDLNYFFKKKTVNVVCEILESLNLPIPKEGEFMSAREGSLIFLNDYGCVLRIEYNELAGDLYERLEHPNILQPIASIRIDDLIMEICPGVECTDAIQDSISAQENLLIDNLYFWDSGVHNVGISPIKLDGSSYSTPIVIDRIAVKKSPDFLHELADRIIPKRNPFPKNTPIIIDHSTVHDLFDKTETIKNALWHKQHQFYAPLKDAFQNAVNDNGLIDRHKIEAFWSLCREFKNENKLISGWAEEIDYPLNPKINKQMKAFSAGLQYKDHLKQHRLKNLFRTP